MLKNINDFLEFLSCRSTN